MEGEQNKLFDDAPFAVKEETGEALTERLDTGQSETKNSENDFRAAYLARLQALPGIVPELVTGESLQEIEVNLEKAKLAYQRIADELTGSLLFPVPTGGNSRHAADFETGVIGKLDAVGKIAYGIEQRVKR